MKDLIEYCKREVEDIMYIPDLPEIDIIETVGALGAANRTALIEELILLRKNLSKIKETD